MMNSLDMNNYEVESKLEKEEANLNLLKERLAKNVEITNGMDKILNSFEQRLLRLEDTILPVYNDTENLQRCQMNVDKTLKALDNVIGYYFVSQEVETVIQKGPGPTVNIDTFLGALNKLAKARVYFEKYNPSSVELENINALFNSGIDVLNVEFQKLMARHNTPILPVTLLNMISVDEGAVKENFENLFELYQCLSAVTTDEDSIPVQIPESVVSELMRMSECLILHNRDDFMIVYGKERGTVMLRSLQNLKEHQRSASGGSHHGVQIGASSPLLRPKFQNRTEVSRKQSTRRLQQAFERKANRMLIRASQTLEHSTGFTLGPRRSTALLDTSSAEEIDSEQEMENYLSCVAALHRLMQLEQNLMKNLIPQTHQPRIFEIIIRDAMDVIVQDGESIASRAKRCISRHDFAAVLVLFPILKQLLSLKPEYEKTLENCDATVRLKFSSILQNLHSTGSKALEDFIDTLRSDSASQLPPDGTVHELTSNVLLFLEQLIDYTDTIGGVLAKEAAYNRKLENLGAVTDKSKALVGLYMRKVLGQLNVTLLSKSEQYSDMALKAIFRLNNCNYVLKSLQQGNLLELIRPSEPQCEEVYYRMMQEHKDAYTQSWSKLLSYIWNSDDAPILLAHGDKLRDKERAFIKERFAGFNKELEDIVRVQKKYSIPDVELRESLKRDNKEYIVPKYNAFYEIYSGVQFTKNPSKYVKYTPLEVSEYIDRFFDVSA